MKPKQIVSEQKRGEWFTNIGKPDGIVYRTVKTGENTAKYEVVARGCSAAVAEQIAALPDILAALKAAFAVLQQPVGAPFRDLCPTTWRKMEAAIAKATITEGA